LQQQPRRSDATSVTSRSPVCTPPRIQTQGGSTNQVTPRVPTLTGQLPSPKRSTSPVMIGANTTPQTPSALSSSPAKPASQRGENSSLASRTSHSAPAGPGRLLQPGGLQRLQLQSRQQPSGAERQQQNQQQQQQQQHHQQRWHGQQHQEQQQPQLHSQQQSQPQQQQQGLLGSRSAASGLPGDGSGNTGASRPGRSPSSARTGPTLRSASGNNNNVGQLGPRQASGCCATRGSTSGTLGGRGSPLLQSRAGTALQGPQQSLGSRTRGGCGGAPPPSTRSPGIVTLGVRERSSSPVYQVGPSGSVPGTARVSHFNQFRR